MVGLGIVWASVLAIPYALLVSSLPPERSGIYMGIFNLFIVLPQIFVSLSFGWVMDNILNNNRLAAVVMGGGFLMVAALLMQGVKVVAADEDMPDIELSKEIVMKT
jgi:maltose/moltooligosaccharide transporter